MPKLKKSILSVLIAFAFLSLVVSFNLVKAQTCSLNAPCDGNTTLKEETTKGDICLYFFFAPGCPECEKVARKIHSLQSQYSLQKCQINAKKNPTLLRSLLQTYRVPLRYWGKVPIVFVGDKFLVGEDISKLPDILSQYSGKKVACPKPRSGFLSLCWAKIALLALTDSINPCALTIFLLLLLVLAQNKKFSGRKIMLNSLSFILAVFIVYFLLGIMIVSGLKWLSGFSLSFSVWLYKILAILAFLLGLYNIEEFIRSKAGTCKIQPLFGLKIKNLLDRAFSPGGMFVAGVFVSLFLLPCSSGPYFVAGGLLTSERVLNALGWLFFYNLIFVLPMLVLALAVSGALLGVSKASDYLNRHLRWFELLAGLLLLVLGIWTWFF